MAGGLRADVCAALILLCHDVYCLPVCPARLPASACRQDVSICLGTSLQIIPAANLPLRTVKAGGALAIINLQATPKDKKAAVVIHAKVDQVR